MEKKQINVVFVLILANVLFGLNFSFNKAVLGAVNPFLWGAIRMGLGAVFLLTIILFQKRKMPPLSDRSYFTPLLVFGGIWISHQMLQLSGMVYTSAANASILHALTPLITLVIVTLKGIEEFSWKKALGFGIAFAGVISIRRIEDFKISDATLLGDILSVGNAILLATFLSYSKKFLQQFDYVWSVALMLLLGSIEVFSVGAVTGANLALPTLTGSMMLIMIFSSFFGSTVPYTLNMWGMRQSPPSFVALLFYIQPIVGITFSWLWLAEPLSLRKLISALTIILGFMVVKKGSPQNKSTEAGSLKKIS